MVRADVKDGKLKADVTGPDGPLHWVVDPDHFQIVTTSVVPANHADWISGQDANGQDIVIELREDLTFYHQGLPADSAPGTAAPAAGRGAAGLEHLYLWVEAGRPATGPAWAQDLHVAPMDQADVAAHHVVELYRLAEGARDYDTNLAVRPVVTASNTAIWGPPRSGGQQDQDVNAGRLIPDTLTGLEISPRPQHPDQVSSVPLAALIFEHENPASYGYAVAPAPDPAYTVTVPPHDPDSLPITVTGPGAPAGNLANDGYQLASLADHWVTTQRGAVLDQLRALGFTTLAPDGTDLTAMAATRLTGWPAVARIGAPA